MNLSFSDQSPFSSREFPLLNVLKGEAEYPQALAKFLEEKGLSRQEIGSLLEAWKKTGALESHVNVSAVLASLKAQKRMNEETLQEKSALSNGVIPPVSFSKFQDQHRGTLTESPLTPPNTVEAARYGVYREATVFYRLCFAGKGQGLDVRKPLLLSWIRSLFGQTPPSKVQEETRRRNVLKGWGTRELAFPPPFNPLLQKEKAILLLKETLLSLGKDVSTNPQLLNQAISFYFNQTPILTLDYFDELYLGITNLRLKLTNELERPGSQSFSDEDLKKLSIYLNTREEDLRDTLINKQEQELSLIREYLLVLEYGHHSLKAVYEDDHGINLHPEMSRYEAFLGSVAQSAKDVAEGKHPDIEYRVSPSTPERTPSQASPAN
jgi:hypothetical protein